MLSCAYPSLCCHNELSNSPLPATPSQQTSSTNIPSVSITTRGAFNLFIADVLTHVDLVTSNFTQFYSTKSERDRNLKKEYETQMEYRRHLQAFIDRWRYNANRGMLYHS